MRVRALQRSLDLTVCRGSSLLSTRRWLPIDTNVDIYPYHDFPEAIVSPSCSKDYLLRPASIALPSISWQAYEQLAPV